MEKNTTKIDLILGDEFEDALVSAAQIVNRDISLCKTRNKDNYAQLYELMLASRSDIQSILDTKKRNRTDDDNNKVKKFKKETSQMYRQICDLMVPEELEDGEPTKIEKMISKIGILVKMMDYLGDKRIENELKKYGIELKYEHMSENEMFSQEHIKSRVNEIFERGKHIKEDIDSGNSEIKENIFGNSVPVDLIYDKDSNPTGIKEADFTKLVELKAKMLQAQDDETKEKIAQKATEIVGDKIMQNQRNEIVNKKFTEIASTEETNSQA